jgi:hypothetical protein
MGVISTIEGRPKTVGHIRMSYGRFDDAGLASGLINTNLRMCHSMMLTHEDSSVLTDVGTINATFPCDGSAVEIILNADDTGYWLAFGF